MSNYISGVVRPLNKKDYCNNYVYGALLSSKKNLDNNCGNKGNRWVNDYKSHFDFCMKVPIQTTQQETTARNDALAICNEPTITTTGDLAAYDICYDIDFSQGNITFYPIIKNTGLNDWRSKKESQYIIHHTVGRTTGEHIKILPTYPQWGLKKGQVSRLQGVTFLYAPTNTYSIIWALQHSEDINNQNNEIHQPFDTFGDRVKGINFAEHPWLIANKKCQKKSILYWPLNLHWYTTDLNNIPLNPETEWQIHHKGRYNYYPNITDLAPLLKKREFGVYGIYVKTLGYERDFSKTTNQAIFKEYGGAYIPGGDYTLDLDVSGIVGKCGPHVNWKQPVTYEGTLVGGQYDEDDKDLNFYLYTPKGAGASISSSHEGGIKVEFSRLETIDLLSKISPWWSANKLKFLSKNSLDQIIDGSHTYAIVTGMYGYDCAHECHSELHPAWTMAFLVKDDPYDDTYAIMARNWGNEGFCSDRIFYLNLPKKDNQYIYKFFLRWRPGAESVTLNPIFNQKGGVTLNITPVSHEGVIVSIGFPSPDVRPFIIGELHLTWKYPLGISPQPYPDLKDTDKNALSASKVIVLEDSKMVDDIIKNLPQGKKQIYRDYIDAVNIIKPLPESDGNIPQRLSIDKRQ